MENSEKLVNAFATSLQIPAGTVVDSLSYRSAGWDSVGHLALVAAIEGAFDIMLDTDDVIDMSSVGKAKEILGKYGIKFDAGK